MSTRITSKNKTAIENGFPIDFISNLANQESHRKEVYRPTNYVHKWWAKRLGSVFRGIIMSSLFENKVNIENEYYIQHNFTNKVVFDPFMGSGTTIGEAVKLGCKTIGRDINPVSGFMVRVANEEYKLEEVEKTFLRIENNVKSKIKSFYRVNLSNGDEGEALYYFWVKVINCPDCNEEIELFKNYVFSKHAYPAKKPQAKSLCPNCRGINDIKFNDTEVVCSSCNQLYNPQIGNVNNSNVTCSCCQSSFKLIDQVKKLNEPLKHKMYAKIVLINGEKEYHPINNEDIQLYELAASQLKDVWDFIPKEKIIDGHNTKQVLNYNYTKWYQFFNKRQLLILGILGQEIAKLENVKYRNLFTSLFSSILEFNNMFTSFKGEGTGAVRHMFSNHILKPELTPLEANIWGTPKSSGSFSTLYKSRILRALEYKDNPYEIKLTNKGSEKVDNINNPINSEVVLSFEEFSKMEDSVFISVGDSSETNISSKSVDVVVTDPPFFDNVNYSELADFFYVWLKQIPNTYYINEGITTRSKNEVQDNSPSQFSQKLQSVFAECNRVLKDDGLLVFTYHHSKSEGWSSVYTAIRNSGFVITKVHPIKAEMSVSVPVMKSKKPINFDLIFVCKKDTSLDEGKSRINNYVEIESVFNKVDLTIEKLLNTQLKISIGDIKVFTIGFFMEELNELNIPVTNEYACLMSFLDEVDKLITNKYD